MRTERGIEGVHRLEAIAASAQYPPPARHTSDVTVGSGPGSRLRPLFPWVCLLTGWGIAVATGCVVLAAYAASPGAKGQSLPEWPRDCVIPLAAGRPTLVMFLHPLCPCSRASVDELDELVGRCGNRVSPHVVILRTRSLDRGGGPRVDRSLANVAGITTWDDEGGALSRRFGVLTSGHVLLYDPAGRLLFSGGITPARGHRGDNFGRRAVLVGLLGEPAERSTAPAFGCPLLESQPALTAEACP
jgi:hypothetical protein